MSVLAEFSIVPLGKGESLSPYVARAVRIVKDSGLKHAFHAMGTEIEGESFAQVCEVIGRCLAELHTDCDRVSVSIKIDSRPGRTGQLAGKVASVRKLLSD